MGQNKEFLIEKKLKSVKRGVFWFGIIGQLSLIFGFGLALVFLMGVIFKGFPTVGESSVWESVKLLVYGGLFLLIREAFNTIAFLLELHLAAADSK